MGKGKKGDFSCAAQEGFDLRKMKFERCIDFTSVPKPVLSSKESKDNFPIGYRISFEDCVRLAESRDDLDFDMTRAEYNQAMRNRGSTLPSDVELKWRCIAKNHSFLKSFRLIRMGTRCPICRMITYDDCVELAKSKGFLILDMTEAEFKEAMRNRGKTIRSQVKLRWRCKENDHVWEDSYSSIKNKMGCPFRLKGIIYEDVVKLSESRDDLSLDMTREEFNEAMKNRGSTNPSKVGLRWKCVERGHTWIASYNSIKSGKGCSKCLETSFEDFVRLGNSRDYLDFDITREEFNEAMKNRGTVKPSDVKVRWKCTLDNHKWYASWNDIRSGTGCPHCKITNYKDYIRLGESRDDLDFDMTREEFNEAIKNRGTTVPSETGLRWRCKANNHTWIASYRSIKKGTGCPLCINTTYDDCVRLSQERDNLDFDMTETEFNAVMENRGDTVPSQVKLRWRCEPKGHIWLAGYTDIKLGRGCPICRITTFDDCIELGALRYDLGFDMTQAEFNEAMENRGSAKPSDVKLRWKCIFKDHTWFASYSDIRRGSGCPYCVERLSSIGILAHPIIEYLSLRYLRLKNCQVTHEETLEENFRIDLLIKRDINFKLNIESQQNIIQLPIKIKEISVDFTFSLYSENFIRKCFKGYQSEDRFLLIILIREEKDYTAIEFQNQILQTPAIKNKEHIKVIDLEQYLQFLNISSGLVNWRILSREEQEIVSKFYWLRKLCIDSIGSDTKHNTLIRESKYYSDLLGKF